MEHLTLSLVTNHWTILFQFSMHSVLVKVVMQYYYNYKLHCMIMFVLFDLRNICYLFACVSDKADDSGDEVQLTMEGL